MTTLPILRTSRNHRTYDLSGSNSNKYKVNNQCVGCRGTNTIILQGEQYFDHFQRGTFVQFAFPQLDADDRELILNGWHPECWDKCMGIDEEILLNEIYPE